MKSMQQSIDMRDKLVEKIVQKRVDDLMNPNVTWDAGQLSRPSLASQSEDSSNAAMLLPKSAAPSIANVPYTPATHHDVWIVTDRVTNRGCDWIEGRYAHRVRHCSIVSSSCGCVFSQNDYQATANQ